MNPLKQSGIASIVIILIIVGILVIGGGVWYSLLKIRGTGEETEQLPEFSLSTGETAKLDARCTDENFREANSDVIIIGFVDNVEVKILQEIRERQRKTPPYEIDQETIDVDYTFTTISVDKYFKGTGPDKFIFKYRSSLPTPPEFKKGEKVKLYLYKTTDGYGFVCADLGKETISTVPR